MQIQKGLVKYKDRTDIVCTYGLTDDGKQYYFLDETSIPNGNIIASTVLVEAIDPVVVASSVGVIDKNGSVIIPFENRSIKSITPGLLLVEKANSTTPSVVEAIKLRSDPLSATKLVTTPATIKDNMNARMGNGGRFVFNDQFSEATIFDMNGNNIINNEYYSFIGLKNNEALYFSKNTVDSPVTEFSLTSGGFVEPPIPSATNEPLDVKNTEVTQEIIDGAMVAQENVENKFGGDITAADFENMMVNHEESQVMVDNTLPPDSLSAEKIIAEEEKVVETPTQENSFDASVTTTLDNEKEVYNGFSPADVVVDVTNTHVEVPSLPTEHAQEEKVDKASEDVVSESTDSTKNVDISPVEESVKTDEAPNVETPVEEKMFDSYAPTEEAIELPISTPNIDKKDEEIVVEKSMDVNVDSEKTGEDDSENLVAFDFGDNINYSSDLKQTNIVSDVHGDNDLEDDSLFSSLVQEQEKQVEESVSNFKKDLLDIDLESDIFADSTLHADRIVQDSYGEVSSKNGSNDTMFEDVATTMANLINLNRTQKEKIAAYEEKFEQISATHKKVVEKARSQIREMEVLKAKLKNYETIVTKLESKIQVLDNKVHDQERVISSQTNELESLRPQIEGKKELARVLADAQSLLDQAA